MNITRHITSALVFTLLAPAIAFAAPVNTASSTTMIGGTHDNVPTQIVTKTHKASKTHKAHKVKKSKIHKTGSATTTTEVGAVSVKSKIGTSITHIFKTHDTSSKPLNRNETPSDVSTVSSGATAVCMDGLYSHAKSHSGECSHHGGVKNFLP